VTGPQHINPLVLTCLALGSIVPLTIVLATSSTDAYSPLIWCAGGMFITLTIYEWRRVGHPLTPIGILSLGGFLIFVLRPFTIKSTGTTTAGAIADAQTYQGDIVPAATTAIEQVLVFGFFVSVFYFYRVRRTAQAEAGVTTREVTDDVVKRAAAFLCAALVVALTCTILLVQSSGGLSAHLAGVSVRSSFLAGRYFLTLGYVPLAAALILYLLARRAHPKLPTWAPLGLISATSLLGVAFITGGRGPLLLGAILPLLLVKQLGRRPLHTPAIILLGLGLVVGAMIMSLTLRENVYDDGESLAALANDPVSTLTTRLTSGAETRPFDSLILLNQGEAQGRLSHQYGGTYPLVLTWFVPGSLLPEKVGGANAIFTRDYLPRFYYPDHIETSISAIGEGYWNFGWPGIALIGALVGIAAARFTTYNHDRSLLRTVLFVLLTPLFFSFARGDSYQNLSLVLLTVLMAGLASRYAFGSAGGTEIPAAARVQRAGGAARW